VYDSDSTLVERPRGVFLTRQKLVLAIVVIILVIIGAIVGAVAGVLSSRNATNTTTPTVPPPANMSSNGQIANDSSIAVAGWRYSDNFIIRLVYQDEDDYLHIATLDSAGGEVWTNNMKFQRAKHKTPLAASVSNTSEYDSTKKVRVLAEVSRLKLLTRAASYGVPCILFG
jgi:hypothetical protein